jgi:hypothetical protein
MFGRGRVSAPGWAAEQDGGSLLRRCTGAAFEVCHPPRCPPEPVPDRAAQGTGYYAPETADQLRLLLPSFCVGTCSYRTHFCDRYDTE